jgi:hypothetical protein
MGLTTWILALVIGFAVLRVLGQGIALAAQGLCSRG